MSQAGLFLLLLTAQGAGSTPTPGDSSSTGGDPAAASGAGSPTAPAAASPSTSTEEPAAEAPRFQPPWPPTPPRPRRYGDKGTPEIALGLGYSSSTGFLAAGGFRYFVVDGVAPGFEGTYVSGGKYGAAYGLALAALRFVPLRTTSFALVATARGGRVFLADHDDGWGLGGGLGVIVMMSPNVGLEIGYEALRLLPASFCADLRTCVLQGVVLGLRVVL